MMNFQTIGQGNLHNVIDVFSDVSKQTSFVKCNIKEEKSWICSWIGRKDSGKSYHERKHDVEFRNEFSSGDEEMNIAGTQIANINNPYVL